MILLYSILNVPTYKLDSNLKIIKLHNQKAAPPHSHEYIEIVYICSGIAKHRINGKETILSTGNYFIVDYDTPHTYFSPKENLTIINCLFKPEFIDKAYTSIASFNELCERYFLKITGKSINGPASNQIFKDDGVIGTIFADMYNEFEKKSVAYDEIIKNLICRIIIETIRKVGSKNKVSELTLYLLKTVEQNYRENLSLSALSKEKHFSLSYASAKFHEETKMSFTDCIQRRRIEEACRLLRESELSITQIATDVGYSSIKFFNKIFKKVVKQTPREYRKSHNNII